ncbi:hypothetical protein K4F52_008793 [Lecanicillium sp. MT-2017a]|nr:hypothetical protein K4F52_008793 [Lecanicillium sp. MT-2017a]
MVRVFGSVRSNNASVLDSNLAVPDARSSLELVRTCHQDLQYLISLRNDKLDLLNREPRVLERVNSIIEVATQGLTAACSLVEKCRPEAHSGKLPMHSRMAWRLRDSAAFREQEPIIRRSHTSVLSEISFIRQVILAESMIDLISSIIHEEDEDLEELSPRELDWTPVSSGDLDMLRARDFVSPLGSILSYDFSVSSMQSSQPTRNSTSVGGQCPRRRVISRQYSLPVMSADIFGSSLMSSMPHEWIHTENGADAERLDNNTNRGNCEDPDDSDEPTQPRQSSISKRKRLSRRLSDTDVNAHVTARWAQESIDMFIPTPGDLTNAEAGLEDHQPPPPYQEELRTGEIDFSFLDELCHGSIPSSQAGTVNNEIYELP